jgi:glutamyl-tRNA synthetase
MTAEFTDGALKYLALNDERPCPTCGSVVPLLPLLVAWLRDTKSEWSRGALEADCRVFADKWGFPFPIVCQMLRACVAYSLTSPPVFEVIEILGRDDAVARVRVVAEVRHPWLVTENEVAR